MGIFNREIFSKRVNKVLILYIAGAALGLVQDIITAGIIEDLFDSVSDAHFMLKVMFWVLCFPLMIIGRLISAAVLAADILMVVLAVLARLLYEPTGRFFRIYRGITLAANIVFLSIMTASFFVILAMFAVFTIMLSHIIYVVLMLAILIFMIVVYNKIRYTLRLMLNDSSAEEWVQNRSDGI